MIRPHTLTVLTSMLLGVSLLLSGLNAQSIPGKTQLERSAENARTMFETKRKDSLLHIALRTLEELEGTSNLGSQQRDRLALEAELHTYAGFGYTWKYNKGDALGYFKRALSIMQQLREPDQRLLGYAQWGMGLCDTSYQTQRAFFQQAVDNLVEVGDSVALVGLCTDAGILLYRNGELEQMREVLQTAMNYVAAGSQSNSLRAEFQLGRYYEAIGDDESARFYFENAYALAMADNPNDPIMFSIVRDLGSLLMRVGEHDEALDMYAVLIQPDTPDKSKHRYFAEADIQYERGRVCQRMGNYDDAEAFFLASMQSTEKAGYEGGHIYFANTFSALGALYQVMGEEEMARTYLDKLDEVVSGNEHFEHPDYAIFNEVAARAHIGIDDLPGAEQRILDGFAGLGYSLRDAHNYQRVYRYDLLANLMNLLTDVRALRAEATGDALTIARYDEQLAIHLSFLDSIQQFEIAPIVRAQILESNYHVYERAITRAYDEYSATGDAIYLRRCLDLSERSRDQLLRRIQLQNRLREEIEIDPALRAEEVTLQQELTETELEIFQKGDSHKARLNALEEKRRALNVALADVSLRINRPGDVLAPPLISGTFEALNETIDGSVAFVEFFDGEKHDYVISLWKDNISGIVLDSKTADSLNYTLRGLLTDPTGQWQVAASAVYGQLRPLFEALPMSVDHLVVVPSGSWNYVPFETLSNTADGGVEDMLIYRYRISYQNALHLRDVMTAVGSKPPLVLGAFAPRYETMHVSVQDTADAQVFAHLVRSGNFHLPGAQEEVARIGEIMAGDVYTAEAASEKAFREEAPRYRVLHLSMHALLEEENPKFSRLLFTAGEGHGDGYVFASELSNMRLNAEMAVLSACNTGAGKALRGEGVMSLSRAFQYAGVPSIVHSLWKVPDAATTALMVGFYNHLKTGTDKATAMRNAKLEYLDQVVAPEQAHPYYWAGFVANGATTPLDLTTSWPYAHYLFLLVAIAAVALAIRWRRRATTHS